MCVDMKLEAPATVAETKLDPRLTYPVQQLNDVDELRISVLLGLREADLGEDVMLGLAGYNYVHEKADELGRLATPERQKAAMEELRADQVGLAWQADRQHAGEESKKDGAALHPPQLPRPQANKKAKG